MKCPFKLFGFGKCKRGCAFRVNVRVYDLQTNSTTRGQVCALAALCSNVPNAQFAPVFVSETKCIKADEED